MNPNKLIHKLKQLPRQSFPGPGGETVTTNAATNIEGKQLTINGNLSGGEETVVSSLGFTFGTDSGGSNPFTGSVAAIGAFSQTPTGLTTGETYYFRATATVGPEGESTVLTGTLLSVVNSPTFKGSGQITMTELKEAFDSPEASANVSLDFLSQTSGLNKSANISYSDFYNNDPSLTVFYRGGSCSSTTNTATYHGGSGTVPEAGDYIFTAQVGGRVNFLSNGTYGFNTNGLNSQTVTRQFTVSSGKVTGVTVCGGGRSERRLKYNIEFIGDSPLGIPIYHFNYKNELYGKGRFIGTMVDDLQRLGYEDVLINTDDGIFVDYNKIDVPFHNVTNIC